MFSDSRPYYHKLIETSPLIKHTAKEDKPIGYSQEKLVTHCLGRFCLDIPSSMHRCNEFYNISNTRLQEEYFIPPFEGAYERAWLTNLVQIEALKKNRNNIKDLHGEIIEKRPLTDLIKGVFFFGSATNQILTLEALLNVGPLGLWLQVDDNQSRTQQMAEHVKKISAEYRLLEREKSWPIIGKDWFYLNRGAIARSSFFKEEASVDFKSYPLNIELNISTKTINEPSAGLIERFNHTMMNAIAWKNGGITFLKKRTCKVNVLMGEEILFRDSNRGKLSFLWNFPGEPNAGRLPEITISMNTPDQHFNEKVAFWDTVLNSIKSVSSLKESALSFP